MYNVTYKEHLTRQVV